MACLNRIWGKRWFLIRHTVNSTKCQSSLVVTISLIALGLCAFLASELVCPMKQGQSLSMCCTQPQIFTKSIHVTVNPVFSQWQLCRSKTAADPNCLLQHLWGSLQSTMYLGMLPQTLESSFPTVFILSSSHWFSCCPSPVPVIPVLYTQVNSSYKSS